MSSYILERRSDKPLETKPIFSDVGSEIRTATTKLTRDSKFSPWLTLLLANGWGIDEVRISGGYLMHLSPYDAKTIGTWGFYYAVNSSAKTGGIVEEGSIYSLYDNGRVRKDKVKRDTSTNHVPNKADKITRLKEIFEASLPEEDYGLFQKPAFREDDEQNRAIFDFIGPKIPKNPQFIYSSFHPRIHVEQTIRADGKPSQLVTLTYLEARNFSTSKE